MTFSFDGFTQERLDEPKCKHQMMNAMNLNGFKKVDHPSMVR